MTTFAQARDGVAVICASKNRTESLIQALASWVRFSEIEEIILVDWGSSISFAKELKLFKSDKRIKIVEVEGEDYWNLTRAYNLAARFASRKRLLKIDADVVLLDGFFESHALREGELLRGNAKSLTGTCFMLLEDFRRVNGYNENLIYYGYDDIDLYHRIGRENVKLKNFDLKCLFHIPHSFESRFEHLPPTNPRVDPGELAMRNAIIAKSDLWGKGHQQSVFKIRKIGERHYRCKERRWVTQHLRANCDLPQAKSRLDRFVRSIRLALRAVMAWKWNGRMPKERKGRD